MRVIGTLYAGLATLGAPGLRVMLRGRVRRGKEIAGRLPERRGVDAAPRPRGKLLWLHAASVGEAVSVLPVLGALPPHVGVLMTTGTVTSAELLARRLPELGLGRVIHRFAPLDVPAWTARFLDHWHPDAAAFVESELWPNVLAACGRRAIPVMLVNARLSQASFRAWSRAPGFAADVMGGITCVWAQSAGDAERLRGLGAPMVRAAGNLKFAAPPLPADPFALADLSRLLAGRPVWLAAATHAGDDAIVLDAHRRLLAAHPDLLTIIAPRHPARGAAIADAPRRAAGQPPDGPLWIADTLGELGLLFRLAPVVFVGNSLSPPGGGHNVLEPARLGCAVATGPHMANFEDAVEALGRALARVTDAASLAAWVHAMLSDPAGRADVGARARTAADGFADLAGADGRGARAAGRLMRAPGFWQRDGALPALLSPVSAVVAAGTARRVARPGWRAPVPVICCGNATVGGAGKTTLALDLARRLAARGTAVHILLRGYGGSARGPRRVRPDDTADLVGDEALLLAAAAPTWTGADRAATARVAIAEGAAALLLDDGLQNPTLAKTLSLLVVDPDGLGNGRVLPAGPLREPIEAAAARCRAAIVIRAGASVWHGVAGLTGPVLHASLAPRSALGAARIVAFAGIGRPEKFFATAERSGAILVARHGFPDHHRYTASELRALLAEAAARDAIPVTTPKDAVRLPVELRDVVRVIGVGLEWDDPDAPERLLDEALG